MQKRIRIVVVLGTISLIGLIITQLYWIQKAFDIREKELDQSIQVALIEVSKDMAAYTGNVSPNPNPVVQLSSNYYVVNINDIIDANVLEHYLLLAFQKNGIPLNFEYAIYDCESDQMVYGNFISQTENEGKDLVVGSLPKYDKYIYYFGVRFPEKTSYIAGDYRNWLFSSLILIIVIIFFSVTLFIILQQKKLSEIQKDFINNMTHEFKTPISTIKVSIEYLLSDISMDDSERRERYLSIIQKENDRLHQQVDTVLRMADIEKESTKLRLAHVDLHDIIKEIGHQMEMKLNEGGKINYKLEAKEAKIEADILHVKNVISNLLDNAIKYSHEKVDILISTRKEANHLILEIKDKGIGIAPDQQKKIFQKFYRVQKGNVHDVKGFGLGLNYVWNVIKNHHWKIEVHSQPQKGTMMRIIITQ
jgi:two-component system phosphate regulon sensor histidine kinase PhoR